MNYDEELRGLYWHKKTCMSGIVNPITKWAGGAYVRIIGYKCPECGVETYFSAFKGE